MLGSLFVAMISPERHLSHAEIIVLKCMTRRFRTGMPMYDKRQPPRSPARCFLVQTPQKIAPKCYFPVCEGVCCASDWLYDLFVSSGTSHDVYVSPAISMLNTLPVAR